jgi:hypothetical protein
MSIEPVSSARPSEIEHVEWALRDGALADRGFIVFVCRVTVVEAPVKDKGGRAKRGNRRRLVVWYF